ncbi:hypothetical protein [Phenylobacterium sp.]|uniref:hypothetical protein n=1 Tax=Phenylobacterium sp. TaxID=1871053 RepID=UPI002812866F|nr:hypothetical protein [Phenylobacterium sp.]
MVVGQEKPSNVRGAAAPKGRMTWMALIGIAVFLVLLFMLFLRPADPERRGRETASPPGAPSESATPPASSVPAG